MVLMVTVTVMVALESAGNKLPSLSVAGLPVSSNSVDSLKRGVDPAQEAPDLWAITRIRATTTSRQ